MKILCRTLFDCTRTGTTGHFRLAQLPLTDSTGKIITSIQDWNWSRNQQRNFETIMQMISLRAQPTVITDPMCKQGEWQFEFEVETEGVYSINGNANDITALAQECQGTPMILGLQETRTDLPYLSTQSHNQNIWFDVINIP